MSKMIIPSILIRDTQLTFALSHQVYFMCFHRCHLNKNDSLTLISADDSSLTSMTSWSRCSQSCLASNAGGKPCQGKGQESQDCESRKCPDVFHSHLLLNIHSVRDLRGLQYIGAGLQYIGAPKFSSP